MEGQGDKIESGAYLICNGAGGTGGMLTMTDDTLKQIATKDGKQISTYLYGQQTNSK
jgi:type I restriction enzyme M protein